MSLEPWKLMVGLMVVLATYWIGSEIAGSSASAGGLILIVVFGAIGILLGRRFTDRMQ